MPIPRPLKMVFTARFGDRGGGPTKPEARAHEKICPTLKAYPPPPIGAREHGVLTAGRGASSTHAGNFFGSKNHRAARIMRAPARPGCGHISRTKRPPATHGCDPGTGRRFPGVGDCVQFGHSHANRKKPPQLFPRVAAIRLLTSCVPWCTGFRQ